MTFKRLMGAVAIAAVCAMWAAPPAGAQQKAPEFTLKLGHGSQLKSPLQTTGEEFARRIAEKTGWRVKIEVYGNMQLG
jgi:TRAP-type C4-dicarboxylate transport system substrate-binding protein